MRRTPLHVPAALPPDPDDPGTGLLIATAISRMAEECAALAAAVDELQDEIGSLLPSSGGAVSPATIRTLQDADRIGQTLRSLSSGLARVASAAPAIAIDQVALAKAIPLESVASRVLSTRDVSPAAAGDEPGHPDTLS